MNNSFEGLGLKQSLIEGLIKNNINTPTDIQASVIPLALQNRDIIGQSETGTGKTLAFLLPIFQRIDLDKKEMQAIILAPTHELAMQIYKEIELLAKNSNMPVTAASIIGEVNVKRQIEKLKGKPHIIVGSTGRIHELIKMKKITAYTIKTIVIDEADRLLDKNNLTNVKAVIKTTMRDRQLLLFSATLAPQTIEIARELMKNPEIVSVKDRNTVNPDINHYYFVCEQRDKIDALRKLIHIVNPERALVFINKSDNIEITTNKLKFHKLRAEGLTGAHSKEERKKAMDDFRSGKIQILVASDIAARGLDIKGVTHIFNLDIPEDPKNYLHRVGRTARAGEKGMAISIVTEKEIEILDKYEKVFEINIQAKDMVNGNVVDKKKVSK